MSFEDIRLAIQAWASAGYLPEALAYGFVVNALLAGLMEQPGRAITRARLTALAFGAEPPTQPDAVEVVVGAVGGGLHAMGFRLAS